MTAGVPSPSSTPPRPPHTQHVAGSCYVYFAYDIGLAVDLDLAATRVREAARRQQLPVQRRRGASWLAYEPAPLRITLASGPIRIGESAEGAAFTQTDPAIECTVFDFGGVSIRYRIAIDGPLEDLPPLSDALYENLALLTDSRKRVEEICAAIEPAISHHEIAPLVEDYAVFSLERWEGDPSPDALIARCGQQLARVLRAEAGAVSPQQAEGLLAERLSFGPADAVLASWECAVVLDPDPAGVLTVLEHVNMELAEMRLLDRNLDRLLGRAYALLQKRSRRALWPAVLGQSALREIAAAQVDAAMLFESVNNAIKLVGDQHLARVYNLAAGRVHLAEWDAAILRKLDTAESIYQKLSQFETGRRMEVLEIVIVVLIALSIVLTFVPGGH